MMVQRPQRGASPTLVRLTNALGDTVTAVYDQVNQPVATVDPLAGRASVDWDGANRPMSTVNALGNRSTIIYDPDGLRVQLDDSTGATKFIWDKQMQQLYESILDDRCKEAPLPPFDTSSFDTA